VTSLIICTLSSSHKLMSYQTDLIFDHSFVATCFLRKIRVVSFGRRVISPKDAATGTFHFNQRLAWLLNVTTQGRSSIGCVWCSTLPSGILSSPVSALEPDWS
jgi:hypothetical protein